MSEDIGHSILAPSSASRWIHCEGSVMFDALYPEPETDHTREGTAAHWLATDFLYMQDFRKEEVVGLQAPNGVEITEDMYYGALDFRTQVMPWLGADYVAVEQNVSISRVHDTCFGTPDFAAYSEEHKQLYVEDYKFGFKPVSSFENEQLIMYATGLMDELGLIDMETKLVLGVTQPRAFSSRKTIRHWKTNGSSVRAKINTLAAQARNALGDSPATRAGPWCEHCPGRHVCDANRAAVGSSLEYIEKAVPNEMSEAEMAYELTMLERAEQLVKGRKDALETQVENIIRSGKSVPGYHMEERMGHSKYNVEDQEIINIGELLGVDLSTPPKAKSPRQAKLTLKDKDIDESVISAYIERPVSGMKLTKDDNSRLRYLLQQEQ